MPNIVVRGITGLVYVLSVIAAIFIHPIVCVAYFFIIAIAGQNEFYHNVKKYNIKPNILLGNLLGIILYFMIVICSSCEEDLSAVFLAALIVVSLLVFIVELYSKAKEHFTNVAYTFLGGIYAVVPLALTSLIISIKGDFSPMILMSVFIFAWCNDTFAYLTGMKFGKHKLFERISPKKTWEGSIGGAVSVIIAAVIISLFSDSMQVYDYIIIAVLTSIVGTFGDLAESMFKRQIGVKDSGNILPGHGGILDRFDILLLVLPVVYAYLKIRFIFC